jgi:hypothetical protein
MIVRSIRMGIALNFDHILRKSIVDNSKANPGRIFLDNYWHTTLYSPGVWGTLPVAINIRRFDCVSGRKTGVREKRTDRLLQQSVGPRGGSVRHGARLG